MKYTINSYLAVLIVTIVGAGASMIIVHVAYDNAFAATLSGGGAEYTTLQQSILNP